MKRDREDKPPVPPPPPAPVVRIPPTSRDPVMQFRLHMSKVYADLQDGRISIADEGLPYYEIERVINPNPLFTGPVGQFTDVLTWARGNTRRPTLITKYSRAIAWTVETCTAQGTDGNRVVLPSPMATMKASGMTYADFCDQFDIPYQLIALMEYGVASPEFLAYHTPADPNGLTREEVYGLYDFDLRSALYYILQNCMGYPAVTGIPNTLLATYLRVPVAQGIPFLCIVLRILRCIQDDEDRASGNVLSYLAGGPEDIPLPPTPPPEGVPKPPPAPILREKKESTGIELLKELMQEEYEAVLNFNRSGLIPMDPLTGTQTYELTMLLDPDDGIGSWFRESLDYVQWSHDYRRCEAWIVHTCTVEVDVWHKKEVSDRPIDDIMLSDMTYHKFCNDFRVPYQIVQIAVYGIPPPEFFARHTNVTPTGVTRAKVYDFYNDDLSASVGTLVRSDRWWRPQPMTYPEKVVMVAEVLRILMCKDEDMQRAQETGVYHAGGPEDEDATEEPVPLMKEEQAPYVVDPRFPLNVYEQRYMDWAGTTHPFEPPGGAGVRRNFAPDATMFDGMIWAIQACTNTVWADRPDVLRATDYFAHFPTGDALWSSTITVDDALQTHPVLHELRPMLSAVSPSPTQLIVRYRMDIMNVDEFYCHGWFMARDLMRSTDRYVASVQALMTRSARILFLVLSMRILFTKSDFQKVNVLYDEADSYTRGTLSMFAVELAKQIGIQPGQTYNRSSPQPLFA